MRLLPHGRRGLALFAAGAVLAGLAIAVPPGVALWLDGDRLGDDRPGVVDNADGVLGAGACAVRPPEAVRQIRGMTITTVNNMDWPSAGGLDAEAVKAQYREWLEVAQRLNLNAVFVQIRPSGDAFWPSAYAPWSQWLTGRRDGLSPGWDPLAFLIAETHARNLEFHAWFNPYRADQPAPVGAGGDITKLAPNHPLRHHPQWAVVYPAATVGSRLYYNPGIPDARRFVEDSILEAVARYDIDSVFFDDFFYPYPQAGQDFDDAATFARYGAGYASRADWRRDNVNKLVQEMGQRIKAIKPWVKFGISPFGIWRNQRTDPIGSPTRGLQSHDEIYADTRRWVTNEWVDFIAPQLYWHIGNGVADYAKLVPWWSRLVAGTRVQLYIAHGDYRVGEAGAWRDPAQLDRQLALDDRYPVAGSLHFSATHLRADRLGSVSRYRSAHYAQPALVPTMAHLPASPPPAPTITEARRDAAGAINLTWHPGAGRQTTRYAVYRVDPAAGPGRAAALVASRVNSGPNDQTWIDRTAVPGRPYSYCVTALDRLWNEGPASVPYQVD